MARSTKLYLLVAALSITMISIFSWTGVNAYNPRCNAWPNHSQSYTFDPSVPASFYSAINDGAFAWTNSASSTWAWINTPTSGWPIKHVTLSAGTYALTNLDPDSPCTTSVNFMDIKFNSSIIFYTGTGTPPTGQVDLRAVATHEFGHGVGLADVFLPNAVCPSGSGMATMCQFYNGTDMRTLEPDDTAGLQYFYPPLVQWYWRGSEGRSRQVPIINGVPNFSQAQPWSSAVTALPGSGSLQALAYVAVGSTMYQELWQNNTRWTRSIPIVGGIVQDGSGTLWLSGLSQFSFGTMPDTSPPLPALDVQVNNFYVLCTTLKQQFWRNDKGFYRDIPITSGVPQWGSAGAWQGPVSLSGITAGSGSLQAYSVYRVGDHLTQTVWRNNLGYYRDVPLSGCTENWSGASAWNTTGIPLSSLPGSGDMRGQDNYELRQ